MNTLARVSNRQIRRTVNAQAGWLEQHHDVLQKLIHDEMKTRGRVDALEEFRGMTFWQRLRWLVKGYRG